MSDYTDSIYIDANINIRTDYMFKLIDKKQKNLLLGCHYGKNCIYDEFTWAFNSKIDDFEILAKHLNLLKEEQFPLNWGLADNSIIYRHHCNEQVKNIMEQWWYIVEHYSKRDQLSLAYVLWKNKLDIKDYMVLNFRMMPNDFAYIKHLRSR